MPGSESQVLRPIIRFEPMVTCLKCFRSVDCLQGKSPSFQIAPFRSHATIMPSIESHRYWGFDVGVMLVTNYFDVLVSEIIDVLDIRVQLQSR